MCMHATSSGPKLHQYKTHDYLQTSLLNIYYLHQTMNKAESSSHHYLKLMHDYNMIIRTTYIQYTFPPSSLLKKITGTSPNKTSNGSEHIQRWSLPKTTKQARNDTLILKSDLLSCRSLVVYLCCPSHRLVQCFLSIQSLRGLLQKTRPKETYLISCFSQSSVVRAFRLRLILDQATFCLSRTIAWEVLPSRTSALCNSRVCLPTKLLLPYLLLLPKNM